MFPESLENLPHSTIVTGNRQANLSLLKEYLSKQGIETVGNPDWYLYEDEQLLMPEAERITKWATSKKVGDYRFCVISADRIAADVQNTLLKTLEEPQAGTFFILLVPDSGRMIATVLSRCLVIPGDEGAVATRLEAREFLKSALSERFALIEDWTKNKKDEDNLSKSEVVGFLDQLEKFLWGEFQRGTPSFRGGQGGVSTEALFADLRKMRTYAGIRGASHRVILDYVAMVAPVVK